MEYHNYKNKEQKHKDIFLSDFKIPEEVYLVCPGSQGTSIARKLGTNQFIWAVNGGVTLPKRVDVWCVECYVMQQKNWWGEALEVPCTRLFSCKSIYHPLGFTPEFPYDYTFQRDLKWDKFGTSFGISLWLLVKLGAKKIICCGADGGGFNAVEREERTIKRVYWNHINLKLLPECKKRGVKVVSLSPTKHKISLVG